MELPGEKKSLLEEKVAKCCILEYKIKKKKKNYVSGITNLAEEKHSETVICYTLALFCDKIIT